MKQFKPGDFCRFQNEQIPRILDILRANDFKIHNGDVEPDDKYVVFCDYSYHGGQGLASTNMENPQPFHKEIDVHTFMVKAMRLEEGMGIHLEQSSLGQRKHIAEEMEKIGIKQTVSTQERGETRYAGSFMFSAGEWKMSTANVKTIIPYHQWCRRLCVEPITEVEKFGDNTSIVKPGFVEEKTLEQHVDEYDAGKRMVTVNDIDADGNLFQKQIPFNPNDPWEMSDNHSNWVSGTPYHYVGLNMDGYHVVQPRSEVDEYESATFVRNIPEFNASMLEVGEYMVVEEDGKGLLNYNGAILFRSAAFDLICIPPNHDCTSHTWDKKATIKGRKVQVEIKIIEP